MICLAATNVARLRLKKFTTKRTEALRFTEEVFKESILYLLRLIRFVLGFVLLCVSSLRCLYFLGLNKVKKTKIGLMRF